MSENESIDEIRAEKRASLREATEEAPAEEEPAGEAGGVGPTDPVHVNSSEELAETTGTYDVVLVDFYADWCGPCKMIEPVVEDIAAETDAAVAKVDVDRNQQLAMQNGVQGVPMLALFVDGDPVERVVGAQGRDALFQLVEQYT